MPALERLAGVSAAEGYRRRRVRDERDDPSGTGRWLASRERRKSVSSYYQSIGTVTYAGPAGTTVATSPSSLVCLVH